MYYSQSTPGTSPGCGKQAGIWDYRTYAVRIYTVPCSGTQYSCSNFSHCTQTRKSRNHCTQGERLQNHSGHFTRWWKTSWSERHYRTSALLPVWCSEVRCNTAVVSCVVKHTPPNGRSRREWYTRCTMRKPLTALHQVVATHLE